MQKHIFTNFKNFDFFARNISHRHLVAIFSSISFSFAHAELISEVLDITPGGPYSYDHVYVKRFYSNDIEANQECNALAETRSGNYTGCFGPSPLGNGISKNWGGWFGKCITGSCDINPNARLYLDFFGCTKGYKYTTSTEKCIKDRQISIEGASSTIALPVGPTLLQKIKINDSAGNFSNISINIKLFESDQEISEINTMSNSIGEYNFLYVPPYFESKNIYIKATCTECENTATQLITILPVEQDPLMCYRE